MLSITFVKLGDRYQTLELKDGSTVREAIAKDRPLEGETPKIYINGKPQGIDTVLRDGDMLVSIPRIRGRWKEVSERMRQNPPLHGLSDYIRQCSAEFREDFSLTKDDEES